VHAARTAPPGVTQPMTACSTSGQSCGQLTQNARSHLNAHTTSLLTSPRATARDDWSDNRLQLNPQGGGFEHLVPGVETEVDLTVFRDCVSYFVEVMCGVSAAAAISP
jgi:hypothetical protein